MAALLWRRWGWIAFIPALTVGWSRIYVGSHWPTDVLAGIGIGLGAALLSLLLAEIVWRRIGPRFCTAVAARYPSLLFP